MKVPERKFQSISYKISAYIFGITAILGVISISALFWIYHQAEIKRVQRQIQEIERTHVPLLTSSLWDFHFSQLKLHLEGMLNISHVQHVQLTNEGEQIVYGERANGGTIDHLFPLIRDQVGPIGHLKIRFSKQSIRIAAFHQLRNIIIPALLHMVLVNALFLWVFHRKIARHLADIGAYAKKLTADNLDTEFRFDRNPSRTRADELDLVLHSFDQMRINLADHLEKHKTMERRIANTMKMKAIGTLAGGVAHDLNNILAGIVSYPDLLMLEYPEGSRMRKSLETIKNSGLRASAIVQDLLTLARRAAPVMGMVDINRIAADYLESPEYRKLQSDHPEVAIETGLEACGFFIRGSSVHLSKTLMNLVSNACEAIDGPGTVTVKTRNRHVENEMEIPGVPPGDYVMVTVADDGSGIAPEDLERVFEPFYTKKTLGRSGTGLGMAVVYGTVQDHDGHIDIRSKLGEGTQISIFFPASRQHAAEADKKEVKNIYGNGETILIVDDIPEQRDIAGSILTKLGYRVVAVSSGEEALAYLERFKVNLVVLDMIMAPGLDGLETFLGIRRIHPDQSVIIASGYSETKRVKEALRKGARGYIRKPYLLEVIGEAVKNELDATTPHGLVSSFRN